MGYAQAIKPFAQSMLALWLLIGTAMFSTHVSAQRVEIITLQHRPAEMMAEQIKALYPEQQVHVAGRYQQLTVRADDATLAEIRKLIHSFDTPLRQYVISISNDQNANTQNKHWGGSGVISNNGSTIKTTTRHKTYQTRGSGSQSVTVVEGHSTYVSSGQVRPVRNRQLVSGQVVGSIDYVDLTSGVYVEPRYAGSGRVELKIRSQSNEASKTHRRQIDTSSVDTVRVVRLGEWVNVGGTYFDTNSDQSGIGYSTKSRSTDQQSIMIKVDQLPD